MSLRGALFATKQPPYLVEDCFAALLRNWHVVARSGATKQSHSRVKDCFPSLRSGQAARKSGQKSPERSLAMTCFFLIEKREALWNDSQ